MDDNEYNCCTRVFAAPNGTSIMLTEDESRRSLHARGKLWEASTAYPEGTHLPLLEIYVRPAFDAISDALGSDGPARFFCALPGTTVIVTRPGPGEVVLSINGPFFEEGTLEGLLQRLNA